MREKFGYFSSFLFLTIAIAPAGAEVIPDRSLPANSIVVPVGGGNLVIEGGTTRGSNLFHSFERFSVPAGTSATFNNDAAIVNIFSRVTGGNISRIDGILAANGRANLFLLNPNGIVFGPNASLVLGGSFVATTGESIRFADGGKYSSRNPGSSVLTISLPSAISVSEPGEIAVGGNGHNFYREPTIGAVVPAGPDRSGLRVLPGRTITLIGGDIRLDGGKVAVSSGNIYIGAVGEGEVGLDPIKFAPTYTGIERFKDISLAGQALLEVSGFGGGEIGLRGDNFLLTDASLIANTNYGSVPSEPVRLEFNGDATLIGSTERNTTNTPERPVGRGIASQSFGEGDSAPIFVSARSLVLRDNAGIGSQSAGPGRGGDLTFEIADTFRVLGKSPFDPFPVGSVINATTVGVGDGGAIAVRAEKIEIGEGGLIASSTFGSGRGGSIRASAGTITVARPAGTVENAFLAGLGTVTTNTGPAGDLSIEAGRLDVSDGGLVSARTVGPGNGGTITIGAGEIDLRSTNGKEAGITSSATAPGAVLTEATLPNIGEDLIGNAGNVRIEAGRVTLSGPGSAISVVNRGRGTAGSIFLNGGRVILENGAAISANSFARDGGDIALRSDFLGLFGGSSITANAIVGNGGNVTIGARALFSDPTGRITASSDLGLQGRVSLNTGNFQLAPSQVKFPARNDFESVAASSCVNGNESQYRFTITGSGGSSPVPERITPRLTLEQLRGQDAIDLRIENGRVFAIGCR